MDLTFSLLSIASGDWKELKEYIEVVFDVFEVSQEALRCHMIININQYQPLKNNSLARCLF